MEAPYTINSMDFKANDKISFRVVDPVKVDGVTLIEQGATATAHIVKAKRGGHWGKAGLFVFAMQSVTAIDGTQIPLRTTQVRLRGDSKGAKVATAMVITGALMPFIAPSRCCMGSNAEKTPSSRQANGIQFLSTAQLQVETWARKSRRKAGRKLWSGASLGTLFKGP